MDPVEFECALCGHRHACHVDGLDGALARGLDARGATLRAAMANSEGSQRDACQSLALARCPKCQQRNPSEVRSFWTRALATMAGAAAGMATLAAVAASLDGVGAAVLIYGAGALLLPVLVYKAFTGSWEELRGRVHFHEAAPDVAVPAESHRAA